MRASHLHANYTELKQVTINLKRNFCHHRKKNLIRFKISRRFEGKIQSIFIILTVFRFSVWDLCTRKVSLHWSVLTSLLLQRVVSFPEVKITAFSISPWRWTRQCCLQWVDEVLPRSLYYVTELSSLNMDVMKLKDIYSE